MTERSWEFTPRPIRTFRDAEVNARDFLIGLGFDDAVVTGDGADGGVDVRANRIVGQVKAEVRPVGRPVIQQIAGCAVAEDAAACCFALGGYTADAAAWADRANVALFVFDLLGAPEPINQTATRLVESSASRVLEIAAELEANGQVDGAVSHLRELMRDDRHQQGAALELGFLYLRHPELDDEDGFEAYSAFDSAIGDDDALTSRAYAAMATLDRERGELERAERNMLCAVVLSGGPSKNAYRLSFAEIAMAQGNDDLARQLLVGLRSSGYASGQEHILELSEVAQERHAAAVRQDLLPARRLAASREVHVEVRSDPLQSTAEADPTRSGYLKPPSWDDREIYPYHRIDPPSGLMAPYVGEQLSVNELARWASPRGDEPYDAEGLYGLRAFEVLPLLDVSFECDSLDLVAATLDEVLSQTLPGTHFTSERSWRVRASLLKYAFVELQYPAPQDERTYEPMSLEVFCVATHVGDIDFATAAWHPDQLEDGRARRLAELRDSEHVGSVTAGLRIAQATWSNVWGLRYRVPFYM